MSRLERLTASVTSCSTRSASRRGARAVRRLLVGALRLVPRARQAAPLRGGQRGRLGRAAPRRSSGCSAAPSGDAVRDRGDLVAPARRARAARGRPLAGGGRRRCATRGRGRVGRLIEAVTRCAATATRWAPGPAAAARRCSPPTGYDGLERHLARLARFELVDGRRRRRRPGRRWRSRRRHPGARLGRDRSRRGGAAARGPARAAEQRRSSAPSASSPTRVRAKAPPEVVEAEREEARRAPRGAEAAGRMTFRQAEEYLLGPRAVRDALRPRPHAQADDRARAAAAALRVDPRGRHQRQVVDRALLRRDPRAPRHSHGELHLAAPALVQGADRGRGAARVRGRLRRRGQAGGARGGAREPHRRRR